MKKTVIVSCVLSAMMGMKLFAVPFTNVMSFIGEDPKDCSTLTGQQFCDCFRTESEEQCQKFLPASDCVPMKNMFAYEVHAEGSIDKACKDGCIMSGASDLNQCTSECIDESDRYQNNSKGDSCPLDK